jgi:hypothetical protein
VVPPALQHRTTPARYLAFKQEGVAIRNAQGCPKAWISRRRGGDQIDYADESRRSARWFAEALAKHGLKSRMDEAYQPSWRSCPPKVVPGGLKRHCFRSCFHESAIPARGKALFVFIRHGKLWHFA